MDGTTQVVKDQLGRPFEINPQPSVDPAMFPGGFVSPEQAALAGITLPYRQIIRDPFLCALSADGENTPIDRDTITARKCTSFMVVNSNLCWARFRGAATADDVIAEGEGRLIPPGFAGVFSTQYPLFISCRAVVRPGFPLTDDDGSPLSFVPLEFNYGIGGA